MKKLQKICLLLLFLIVAYLIFWLWRYDKQRGFEFPVADFVDNGRDEPYSQNIPLHEMDFEVYRKYFPADAAVNYNLEWMIPLPCDVDYYTSKEDVYPALTLEEGTLICIAPGGSGMNQALIGYGLRCWPDYEEEWRYGCPFVSEDVPYVVAENQMYYVKSEQLEKVAWAFNMENIKYTWKQRTPWAYPIMVTQSIDQTLYSHGAFCPERWE